MKKETEDRLKRVSKAHTRYKTKNGTIVPGATTITGMRSKGMLTPWANKLGLEGVDSDVYTKSAARIGTLAHAMVQAHLEGTRVDTRDFTANEISDAENAYISFLEWTKHHTIEPILTEHQMVSEKYLYGGTVDCYCKLDGVPTLLDFKTGKSIYDEYFYQLAAYRNLLEEQGYEVKQCRILRIGRDESEGFEERGVNDTRLQFIWFIVMRTLYAVEKAIDGSKKGISDAEFETLKVSKSDAVKLIWQLLRLLITEKESEWI